MLTTRGSTKILSLDVLVAVLSADSACLNGFDIKINLTPYSLKICPRLNQVFPRKRGFSWLAAGAIFLRSYNFLCGSISLNRTGVMALAARAYQVLPLVITCQQSGFCLTRI